MLAPNTLLQNRYLVVRKLGEGGMGAVFEAVDQRFGSTVALKMMTAEGDAVLRAFEREARLLNTLRHAALPVVMDYFAESTGQFLVMQYIPGDDLAHRLQRSGSPPPLDLVVRWTFQLLGVLDYLHTRQPPIIHRDVKPQNLKLTPEGDIILLDFGLARGVSGQVASTTATLLGYTPFYSSLEQIRGLPTDARSDLYSLGATIHHLVTGIIPPDALSRADTILQGQPDPLAPAHLANPSVTPEIADVLRRALALKRDERPPTAAAMRAGLEAALRAHPIAAPPAAVKPPSEYSTTSMRIDERTGLPIEPDAPPATSQPAPPTTHRAPTTEFPGLPGYDHTVVAAQQPRFALPTTPNVVPVTTASPSDAPRRRVPWLALGAAAVVAVLGAVALTAWLLLPPQVPTEPIAKPPAEVAEAPAPDAPITASRSATLDAQFPIFDLAMSPSGDAIAAVGDSYDVATWAGPAYDGPPTYLRGAGTKLRSVAIAAGERLVAGGEDGKIRVWSLAGGDMVSMLDGHPGGTFMVKASDDGRVIASAGFDKSVRVWQTAGGPPIATLGLRDPADLVVTLDPSSRLAAFVGKDNIVRIWSIAENRQVASHAWRGREITYGVFSPDARALAIGDKGGSVRLVDAKTGMLLATLAGPGSEVGSLAFSSDGVRLAAGFFNGRVRIWSVGKGRELVTFAAHERFVVAVAFGEGGRTLATADEGSSVRVWTL